MRKRMLFIALLFILAVSGCIGCGKGMNPKLSGSLELAQQYLLEGKYEEAIVEFTKVIEIDAKNAEAYLGRANAYLELAQYEEAKLDYQQVIELNPEQIEPYDALVEIYFSFEYNDSVEEIDFDTGEAGYPYQDLEENIEKLEQLVALVEKGYETAGTEEFKELLLELYYELMWYYNETIFVWEKEWDGIVPLIEKLLEMDFEDAELYYEAFYSLQFAYSYLMEYGTAPSEEVVSLMERLLEKLTEDGEGAEDLDGMMQELERYRTEGASGILSEGGGVMDGAADELSERMRLLSTTCVGGPFVYNPELGYVIVYRVEGKGRGLPTDLIDKEGKVIVTAGSDDFWPTESGYAMMKDCGVELYDWEGNFVERQELEVDEADWNSFIGKDGRTVARPDGTYAVGWEWYDTAKEFYPEVSWNRAYEEDPGEIEWERTESGFTVTDSTGLLGNIIVQNPEGHFISVYGNLITLMEGDPSETSVQSCKRIYWVDIQ